MKPKMFVATKAFILFQGKVLILRESPKYKDGRPFFVNEWRPVVKDELWQIVGTFFECNAESNKVILSEDHDSYEWINPKDFKKYNLIDNLIPTFENYNRLHDQLGQG